MKVTSEAIAISPAFPPSGTGVQAAPPAQSALLLHSTMLGGEQVPAQIVVAVTCVEVPVEGSLAIEKKGT